MLFLQSLLFTIEGTKRRGEAGDSPAVGGPREASEMVCREIKVDDDDCVRAEKVGIGSVDDCSDVFALLWVREVRESVLGGVRSALETKKKTKKTQTHHLRSALRVGRGNFLERAKGHQLGPLRGTIAARPATGRGSDGLANLFHLLLELFGHVLIGEGLKLVEHGDWFLFSSSSSSLRVNVAALCGCTGKGGGK